MTAVCPACSVAPLAQEMSDAPALQFSLPSIHCAACIGKVERRMAKVIGVKTARVNLSMKRLSVTGPVDTTDVLSAMHDIGFDAYPLDAQELSKEQDVAGRGLLIRMAVAGFAMMNVMLLSVAVWSGANDATRDLFHLISAAIALPVVAYAAQPFFKSGWSALRVGALNMDVPISLAILLATGMSLFETLHSGQHAYFDAAISLTFFLLIGRYLDHTTRSAARSAAKELTALEVRTAQRLIAGRAHTVAVSELVLGDHILVAPGARVPVDGRLISNSALVDRSFITGESAAVDLDQGEGLQAGEVNLGQPIEIAATAVGNDTSIRQMAALVETAENSRNSYTTLADKAARVYAPVVHVLALAAFVVWAVATGDIRHALNIAIAVLIITCPCALGLAVPAVTTAAISRLFTAGFLVKHATALERIAEVDHVVFDKTGTLTLPAIAVPEDWTEVEKSVALALAQASSHPLARAMVAAMPDVTPAKITNVTEISGQGVSAQWCGKSVRLGRGDWLGAEFSGLGLGIEETPARAVQVSERVRDGVPEALTGLNLSAEIVTGDAEHPARLLAQKLALDVTADARPEDKLARLRALRAAGHTPLMIGDGLNDTIALAAAHASLAPASALEVSRNAADIIILKPDFTDIPLILKVARMTRAVSKQNFMIAAGYNVIAIPVALAGLATPLVAALAMSASSITVMLNSVRLRHVK